MHVCMYTIYVDNRRTGTCKYMCMIRMHLLVKLFPDCAEAFQCIRVCIQLLHVKVHMIKCFYLQISVHYFCSYCFNFTCLVYFYISVFESLMKHTCKNRGIEKLFLIIAFIDKLHGAKCTNLKRNILIMLNLGLQVTCKITCKIIMITSPHFIELSG